MSSTNLPKAILRSPALNEGLEDLSLRAVQQAAKFNEVLRTSGNMAMQEMHQNRMKALRKELEYLKDTEWKYHPIDKYIGQTF